MALEIERKFIVQGNEWKNFSTEVQDFQQGYLTNSFEEWVVRIRIINNKYSQLTLKSLKDEITNFEFEYPIPIADGIDIWKIINQKIIKKRFLLNFNSQKWVVDVFEGLNYPLVLAEVELDSKSQIIEKPSWCTSEVTTIKKFSNASLAQYPIGNWSIQERESFNLH